MRAVLLIAANCVRQQRLVAILMTVYALAATLFFGLIRDATLEDMNFIIRQQFLYAIFFSGFLAITAFHNELKSRRLLAVLSKAVTRAQYLAGVLVGVQAIVWLYCFVIWAGGLWMLRGESFATQLSVMMLVELLASLLIAAVGLFFATFLPPIAATAATAVLVALPAVLARAAGPLWLDSLPVYSLGTTISLNTVLASLYPSWQTVLIAVLEAVGFWLLAALVFSTRDVAVAVE